MAIRCVVLVTALATASCHAPSTSPPEANTQAPAPAATFTSTPTGFQPLQSAAVKEAIRQALVTGAQQRWSDRAWSGYAVPGPAGGNGCRQVTYTVDQQPQTPPPTITACGR